MTAVADGGLPVGRRLAEHGQGVPDKLSGVVEQQHPAVRERRLAQPRSVARILPGPPEWPL